MRDEQGRDTIKTNLYPRITSRQGQTKRAATHSAMPAVERSQRLFSPTSPFWRVNRELLVGLAGPRALLMELAHPLVAAGVASHSNFRRHPLGRLYRTMRMSTDITFGNAEAARRAARHINRCHQRVHGTLPVGTGPLPVGTDYHANDPLLKLWVLATLIDSTVLVYDLFIKPLSLAEKQAYYRDSQVLARLLGIPSSVMPATYNDFTAYVESMLAGDLLTVSHTAREIVEALFAPPLIGRLVRALSFVGIGLLPERVREAYKFSWDDKSEKRLRRLAEISRRARPLLPSLICISPRALIAERWVRP